MRLGNKFLALLRAAIMRLFVYRVGILIWMLRGVLPLITMFIWMELAKEGAISSYSQQGFAAYFLAVFTVSQIIASSVIGALDADIRKGQLSHALLQPMEIFRY